MQEIEVELTDGRTMAATPWQPHTVAEQLGFEHHFGVSYLNVAESIQRLLQSDQDGGDVEERWVIRTEWLLWFAWRRMPAGKPNPFASFLEQIADYRFVMKEEAERPPDPIVPVADSAPGP